MRIGFAIPNNQGVEDPNDLVAIAVEAERRGYDSVWVREHLWHADYVAERLGDRPYHDALTVLTAIAVATKRVRLGTSVLVLPWHGPARLAKTVATLDQLSHGRVELGIGVAMTRDEYANLGVDFTTRGRRCDEILCALKALWGEDTPNFEGEFYAFSGLKFSPKPHQSPHPPILVAGNRAAARQRTAALGDGWHTLRQSPEQIRAGVSEITRLVMGVGRDPAEIAYSISLPMRFSDKAPSRPPAERTALTGTGPDMIETLAAYGEAGVGEVVVAVSSADVGETIEAMARFMDEVARPGGA